MSFIFSLSDLMPLVLVTNKAFSSAVNVNVKKDAIYNLLSSKFSHLLLVIQCSESGGAQNVSNQNIEE